jgi:hypothetical protein
MNRVVLNSSSTSRIAIIGKRSEQLHWQEPGATVKPLAFIQMGRTAATFRDLTACDGALQCEDRGSYRTARLLLHKGLNLQQRKGAFQ